MDLQRKAIHGLTVSLDEKRGELAVFYGQFGKKLLHDSEGTEVSALAVPRDRVDSWKALMKARESDMDSILEIKAAVTRLQELSQFKKELDRNVQAENSRYRERLEGLGRAVFTRYPEYEADISRDFADTHQRASAEGNSLVRLEEKQDKLRQELEESGFFGQMLVQFRMAGLASNIRQHKARIMGILSDGAEKLLSGGVIADRHASGKLDGESSGYFAELTEIGARREDLARRADSLEADQAAVRSMLDTYAASDNPARRMDDIRFRIKETDKRIDALVIMSAREYCDKFIDEAGASVLGGGGEGNSLSDMGTYSWQIEQAAHLRAEISGICTKIEILETALRIDALDRSIAVWDRSRGDCERKIDALQAQIAKLGTNIEEAETERKRLSEHRESLERMV